VTVPVVVRLDGTEAEAGRKILADSPTEGLHTAPTMLEAAALAVELAGPGDRGVPEMKGA
jgi:succinyl-CoA synthetase beta subunit